MKRMFFAAMMLVVILLSVCVTAGAAEVDSSAGDIAITEVADGATVEFEAGSTEKIDVSYGTNLEGYYLVMMLTENDSGNYIPTKDSIQYIDQATAANGSVEFTVYPKEMTAGKVMLYGKNVSGEGTHQLELATLEKKVSQPSVKNLTGEGASAAQYTFNSDYTTMNVEHDLACVVAIEHADGTYTRLTAVENKTDGGYDFDISAVQNGEYIVIAVKGDVLLNGVLNNGDVLMMKKIANGIQELDELQPYTGDIVGTNGAVNNGDVLKIKQVANGIGAIDW